MDLQVGDGAVYALLGPNGAGKTTLLEILAGVRRSESGVVRLMGTPRSELTLADRARIGYVRDGRSLPGWMRLRELEVYLAPLYPSWDNALADHFRDRFDLDPEKKIPSGEIPQTPRSAMRDSPDRLELNGATQCGATGRERADRRPGASEVATPCRMC